MEWITDLIEARENLFLKELEECAKSGLKTYIYGAGGGGRYPAKLCAKAGVEISGMLEDEEYYREREGVFCFQHLMEQLDEKINLIVSFRGYDPSKTRKYKDRIYRIIHRDTLMEYYWVQPHIWTREYMEEHARQLQWVYESLADGLSRKTLLAYLNQKISMDLKYLKEVKSAPQYFERGIVTLSEEEVFIDCGAYTGDSAMAFVDAVTASGISGYQEIISFEPDLHNFERLCARNLKRHRCINKGVSDKKERLHFSSSGSSSVFAEDGDMIVETDTIDAVLDGGKATFIKMDIEGAELAALRGAKETIQRHKPTLAICIYHRREDLWQIQQYIHELVPEYQFYIRAYDEAAIELVLYAVFGKRQ